MKHLTLALIIFLVLPLQAEIKPSTLFSDHMVLQRDIPIPVWGDAEPGERVTVRIKGRRASAKADQQGRFFVKLRKMKAGGPYKMTISGKKNKVVINDVYVGEVWFASGQSNMDMTVAREDRYWCGVHNEAGEVAGANFPKIRIFDVDFRPTNKVQRNAIGKWEVTSPQTVGRFSAVAYFFARDLYERYRVPIGVITSAYGASAAETWISREALEAQPALRNLLDAYHAKFNKFVADSVALMTQYRKEMLKYNENVAAAKAAAGDVNASPGIRAPRHPNPELNQHNPYVCFNGMIAPVIPYGIRGAIWYQGESNGPTANQYRQIMETLVADWRARWGLGNFPFLYVQLANHGKPMEKPVEHSNMMTVREAQLLNLSIPNTAMVTAIENAKDNPTDIHPKNKQDIGYWLALTARAKAYGEKLVYSGPMMRDYRRESMAVRIFFEHTGSGLKAKNGQVTGFAIRGEDGEWHWAEARIESTTVLVWSPMVEKPVEIRYAWGTNPPASLHNAEGLWTPNFRFEVK